MSAHEGKESAAELGGSSLRADYSSPKGKKHANPLDEDEAKAVHQVATVAQSSIRRLQMVVKEKEEAILSLQNAVSAAYQAALQEQAHNQAQLEALHAVLSVHGEHSIEHMHQSLQILARKKPKKDDNGLTGTLIRSMARLIDDQLQDLTAQHEQEIKALERNMDVYKKQSQELEANLEEERQQHQAHVSQIEEEMQTQRPKEEHIRRLEAEKFQSQLSKEARMLSSRRQGKSTSC
ncbi:hypothetical protein CY35_01G143700 [Sphagnum magellanicum]|nr:hypothetical protein CY35_01G143700 [Sphagnum magellanicum]